MLSASDKPRRMLIKLNYQGSFDNPRDKIYQIHQNDKLTFLLDSKKCRNFKPLLLSNFPKLIKNKYKTPVAPEITQTGKISHSDVDKLYTMHEGYFNTEGSWECEVNIGEIGGNISFQVIFINYTDPIKNSDLNITDFGKQEYILIQPYLKIKNERISLSYLNVQTILPYCIGKQDQWIDNLSEQAKLGYSAFHFPPIQKLGRSGCLYSINDQLVLNPDIFSSKQEEAYAQLKNIIQTLEKNYSSFCFIDILLNHTSCDSDWIINCPGAYYNEKNVPHLASAIAVDSKIQEFSEKLANKQVSEYPKGNKIETEDDIKLILELLEKYVFSVLKIEEYFQVNIQEYLKLFQQKLAENKIEIVAKENQIEDDENMFVKTGFEIVDETVQKKSCNIGVSKYGIKIDVDAVIQQIKKKPSNYSFEAFERAIIKLNDKWVNQAKIYLKEAKDAIYHTIKFIHITEQRTEITKKFPLVPAYFSVLKNGEYAANNGWIMNMPDVQENFAESLNFHYLRRSIVIWTDLVKLRYGNSKADSPKLWKRMKTYVQTLAQYFHGFRLDNAHSTPIHVGEYLLRKARNVNKNLVVFAELFTQTLELDAKFVKRMGLNALIREQINTHNSVDEYNYLQWLNMEPDKYVGSLDPLTQVDQKTGENLVFLQPTKPPTLLYDQTHDNHVFHILHGIRQMLPIIALNSLSNVFCGSSKGYDELYSYRLSVIDERRMYGKIDSSVKKEEKNGIKVGIVYEGAQPSDIVKVVGSWDQWKTLVTCKLSDELFVGEVQIDKAGSYEYKFIVNDKWVNDTKKPVTNTNHVLEVKDIVSKRSIYNNLTQVRAYFNKLSQKLAFQYPKVQVQHHGFCTISIVREHQSKSKSYLLISRCAYKNEGQGAPVNFRVECPGRMDKIAHIFGMSENYKFDEKAPSLQKIVEGFQAEVYEENNLLQYANIYYDKQQEKTILHFFNLPVSTTIVLKCSLESAQKESIQKLNQFFASIKETDNLADMYIDTLSPTDFNSLLYVCNSEQYEKTGSSLYSIPNKGDLSYAGFAGLFKDVKEGCYYNDLNRPLYTNLRTGYWLLDFLLIRLEKGGKAFSKIYELTKMMFDLLKKIPKYHIPYYFTRYIQLVERMATQKVYGNLNSSSKILQNNFSKNLLLAAYQFIGQLPSQQFDQYKVSMSAGLPHFASGWARCWGRDTFISLKGILLIPGLYAEARSIILQYASVLRHGLIPNLLDGGRNPRYNSRDACWWFIKSIKDYLQFTGDYQILEQSVKMVFLDDSQEIHNKLKEQGQQKEMKLYDIMQTIMQKHAEGILYREWRAGSDIDGNMQTEGFNIELKLDEETGLIVGGNQHNCLTWMDKLGTSSKAGNRGIPATPRNGAPIEMTAILKHCLEFLITLNMEKKFPYESVTTKQGKVLKYKEWAQLIQKNFEKLYFVSSQAKPKLAYIYDIYKDIALCPKNPSSEYCLRPNSCIAITLAPELFNPKQAKQHLASVEKYLIEEKSIGIKTLDSLNENYISYYNNSDDGIVTKIAHGFSYHQGPEWVWVYGYFLQALIQIRKRENKFRKEEILSYLSMHKLNIEQNDYSSLPELTNGNGNYNEFSCKAQAWSVGCIIEVLHEVEKLKQ